MSIIKGIPITLYEKTETGTDAFGRPVSVPFPVTVENVLVSPISADDAVTALNLTGKHIVYELCIPKGDNHSWANAVVEFYGQKWNTVGEPKQWIEQLVPLDWNKRIQVERHE